LNERIENQFNILNSKSNLLPDVEQLYYSNLCKAKTSISYIANRIEWAKGVFKNKQEFYNVDSLSEARYIINQALSIISTAYFPTDLGLCWFNNPKFGGSMLELKEITQNKDENPYLELFEYNILPFISKEAPDIIGISIAGDSQLIPALSLSRLIKQQFDNVHVVVGGYVVTLLADTIMKYEELFTTFFDSAILYEGELPLLKLTEAIAEGDILDGVPNLIHYCKCRILTNDILPPDSINSLPTPCFDDFKLESYLSPDPVLPILSSKGCYWGKCAFCSHNESYRWRYRNRDASKIADDLQHLSNRYGVHHFVFTDEAISPASISRLSDELINRDEDYRLSTNIRFERHFTPELCRKMHEAGFRLLYLGLESGCNRILDVMKKGITKEIAAEVCQNIHSADIWNHLYVFFGFPTESREEAQETIDFLLTNKNIINSFSVGYFILNKGAAVAKYPEQYGIDRIDIDPVKDFNLAYNYSVLSGMTNREAVDFSNNCWDKIADEYESMKILNKIDQEDLILYLSHFEQTNLTSKLLGEKKVEEVKETKQITRDMILITSPFVVLEKLRFDLININRNIACNKHVHEYPHATSVIYDPISGKLYPINLLIEEILNLCDGGKSIQQISYILSTKYDASVRKIEVDIILLLQFLLREGFVHIRG
jgi:hypothetical protein